MPVSVGRRSVGRRRQSWKNYERNVLAACCSAISLCLLSVALAEPRWLFLHGGGCNQNYIGLSEFFSVGRLVLKEEGSSSSLIAQTGVAEPKAIVYLSGRDTELVNCVTGDMLILIRTTIAFCILAILSSACAFLLDSYGSLQKHLKFMRRNAVWHILTVILCVAVSGFCFWVSELSYAQQMSSRLFPGKKVEVDFSASFYLAACAGAAAVLGTGFTLLRRYPTDEEEQLQRLLSDYDGLVGEEPMQLERSLPAGDSLGSLPPPPAYVP